MIARRILLAMSLWGAVASAAASHHGASAAGDHRNLQATSRCEFQDDQQCTAPVGTPAPGPVPVGTEVGPACATACLNQDPNNKYFQFYQSTRVCTCFTSICTTFVAIPQSNYVYYAIAPNTCPPRTPTPTPPAAATDPIEIAASSYKARSSVRRNRRYTLQVTLTLPAVSPAPHKQWGHKPINSTDYALLVAVPAGGAVTYRHTAIRPGLKPGTLKKPSLQSNGDLLWARVPTPLYQSKNATRTFKVGFKVNNNAPSSIVFGASVWKDGSKLKDAASVTVAVANK